MILEVSYLTGRVHATPWGHHVNEGLVEWPPSPWRLLRALIAVGFNRLGWIDVPPIARRLLERLAGAPLPIYWLPSATTAHTRHYMPLRDGQATTKVLDTFLHVDGPIRIELDIELDDEEAALLDALLGALSYLGRAESWVSVRRLEGGAGPGISCRPALGETGAGMQRVRLLTPMDASGYAAWRSESVAADVAREESSGVKLTKAKRAALLKQYPEDLVACLCQETRVLHGSGRGPGWNRIPGARWVDYEHPARAVDARPARFAPRARAGKCRRRSCSRCPPTPSAA